MGRIRRVLAVARRHWALSAIGLVALFWLAIPLARQAYYDARVRSMCAKDGGIKVFEQVKLPAERFDQWGGVRIPFVSKATPSDELVMTWEATQIDTGWSIDDIALRRDRFAIVKRTDGRVLGEAISYARRGGDPVGPWEPSSFRCPLSAGDQALIRSVFIR